MAATIEELLLRHLRKRSPIDSRQATPDVPINADAARHYCSHLTERARAQVDPDALAAFGDMVIEAYDIVSTCHSTDRFHNIPKFSAFAFFKDLTPSRLAGAW